MDTDPFLAEHRPPPDADPADLWKFAVDLLATGREHLWAELFAEDGVMEMAWAPEGFPRRIEGRREIGRLMAPVQRRARQLHPSTKTWSYIHHTANPGVIISESDGYREHGPTGSRHRMPYVHVLEIRNGEIVTLRDYAPFFLAPPGGNEVRAALGAPIDATEDEGSNR